MTTIPLWMTASVYGAPVVYALGFFATQHPIPYALAGLSASALMLFLGYHVLQAPAFLISALVTGAVGVIGLAAGAVSRHNAMAAADRAGHAPNAITTGVTPTGMAVIEGRVYDSHNPDEGLGDTTVAVLHTSYQAKTDEDGGYRLEMPDTAFLAKKQVFLEANHSGHYPSRSARLAISAGTIITIDIPVERVVSPQAAVSTIRIVFTDEHGSVAPPEVRPGGRFGCSITASPPLTFDQAAGTPAPGREDSIELMDQETGQSMLRLDSGTPSTQGSIAYMSPTSIFVSGTVPTHYLDGPGNTPRTPLPHTRDVAVTITARLHVT